MKYDHVNVGSYLPNELFEAMESFRWPARMSRSAFVRIAVQRLVESLKVQLQHKKGNK